MKRARIELAAFLALSLHSACVYREESIASCEDCPTMHDSDSGAGAGAGTVLTSNTPPHRITSESSACLLCHGMGAGGYDVFTNASTTATPTSWTPAGDFAWLEPGNRSPVVPASYQQPARPAGMNSGSQSNWPGYRGNPRLGLSRE